MACDRDHAHLIVFVHACGYYLRVATISFTELHVRLLFEGRDSKVATNRGAASIRINTVHVHVAHSVESAVFVGSKVAIDVER